MTITLEVTDEMQKEIEEAAARQGQDAVTYLQTILQDRLMAQRIDALRDRQSPQSLEEIEPKSPLPPGSNGLDLIVGQWPGDETDEEIRQALEEIS
jgi:hypothetical protein